MNETKPNPGQPIQPDPAPIQNTNQERLQEFSIVVADKLRGVSLRWWYGFGVALILLIPIYFGLRTAFTSLIVRNHTYPAYIYQVEDKVPFLVVSPTIFKLSDGSYSGYFKIRNSQNYNWGAANQSYTAIFSTTGGTEVTRVTSSTFVLPSSEKIVVFKRFTADKQPTELTVQLGATQFVQKSGLPDPKLAVERQNISLVNGNLTVTAGINNNTPFTILHVGIPVVVYDNSNNAVAINYTQIDDLAYHESRTFQVQWPGNPTNLDLGKLHVEILPEVNTFDPNIYKIDTSGASATSSDTSQP